MTTLVNGKIAALLTSFKLPTVAGELCSRLTRAMSAR